ncbi:hypothetical protein EHS25_008634 [Saitozyma podzolica]|uniref:Uncharacterized protein n=1 Tax=Saitozyma podzolica TaxID=1890683 RepID=A0A427YME8_9TREE|nr:hypothetical protein EHS25_008634 [Saitozyma podzolica]
MEGGREEVMQSAVKQSLERGLADTVIFEASTRPGDGYIHITDERAIPPAGRIGETEDLIGSVFVENGEVVPSTYEPQPSYRLITQHGPPILPKGIDEHLLHVLRSISAKENGDAPGGDETS